MHDATAPRPKNNKVTRACVDARYAELEMNLARANPPTAKQRRAAMEACAEVIHHPAAKWRAPWVVLLAPVAVLVWLLLSSGCVPAEAVTQCDTEAAINHGHAADVTLPEESRTIGKANEAAWRAQRRALTGEDVPGAETWGAQ